MDISIACISENAILLTWPEKICEHLHQNIIEVQQLLKSALKKENLDSILLESIAAYNSLIIYYDFQTITAKYFEALIVNVIENLERDSVQNTIPEHVTGSQSENIIEIPVYYGKLDNDSDEYNDLASVSKQTGLSHAEIIKLHTATTYRAYALGFTPGFCYLGKLPKQLQLPRRSSPRLVVPKGAVAIAEQQTAVYPNESPGGWHIIGRTPVPMYQLSESADESVQTFTAKVRVGQNVRFTEISLEEYTQLNKRYSRNSGGINAENSTVKEDPPEKEALLLITEMKGRCSFQDFGRFKSQHLGFSASGASDEFSYIEANTRLSNEKGSPVIEILFGQVEFQVVNDCEIALSGADALATINQKPIKNDIIYQLLKGDVFKLNQVSNGLLTYLAIKNGFDCQQFLGSCSQNTNESNIGFGHTTLTKGQRLWGNSNKAHNPHNNSFQKSKPKFTSKAPSFFMKNGVTDEPLFLRFIPSSLFLSLSKQDQQQFLRQEFKVSRHSNRMGYRLAHAHNALGAINKVIDASSIKGELSKPVCFGSIQLPPSGEPIVLMKDRQTIGGYPVLGTVIQTDLFRLAQLRPGETVKFSVTSLTFSQQQLKSFYKRYN